VRAPVGLRFLEGRSASSVGDRRGVEERCRTSVSSLARGGERLAAPARFWPLSMPVSSHWLVMASSAVTRREGSGSTMFLQSFRASSEKRNGLAPKPKKPL